MEEEDRRDVCHLVGYTVVKLVDTVMLATSITRGIVLMFCVILCRAA